MKSISRRSFLRTAGSAPIAAAAISLPAIAVADVEPASVVAPAITAKAPHDWQWWFSDSDGDVFNEYFQTKEAAQKFAADQGGGLIAECLQQDFDLHIDGSVLYEMLQDRNEELIGDGDFIDVTDAQLSELEAAVNAVILTWADKHDLNKTAWHFVSTQNKIQVAASDEYKAREIARNQRWAAFHAALSTPPTTPTE